MKIKKITLQNYRAFKSFECGFESDLNVLVGLNGQGKTSVLDAIAIAYGQFSGGFGTGKDKGILNGDIHLAKLSSSNDPGAVNGFTMEYQFPVTIAVEAYGSEYEDCPDSWERSRNTLKGRTTQVKALKMFAQRLQKDVQNNVRVTLPLISYYGTGRLWMQKQLTEKNSPQNSRGSRLDGYTNCLDPESSYKAFSRWLRTETIAEFEQSMREFERLRAKGVSPSSFDGVTSSPLLTAIEKAVDTVLTPSGWSNLRYSATDKEIVATHNEQGDVPVSLLSDGVRNMIGVVADIAYRAVRLNPHLGENAVVETTGIVLIDEVDMHLHPEWQQLILQELNQAFPRMQFIVTTHSPQILTTVRRENIRLLTAENGVGLASLPIGKTYAQASNDILERVMNVDSKPPLPIVDKYREYMKLVDSGLHDKPAAIALREELDAAFGRGHEYLVKADRSIKRQEFLAR